MSRATVEQTSGKTTFASGAVVLPVSAVQLGIGFSLFRRAALDEEEFTEDHFHPLSDRYALATLSEEGFQRGMSILRIHYDHPDVPTPSMRRIASFVGLLRAMVSTADPTWTRFSTAFDRFTPVLTAIAWCSVRAGESFDASEFMRIAESAPLSISPLGDVCGPN